MRCIPQDGSARNMAVTTGTRERLPIDQMGADRKPQDEDVPGPNTDRAQRDGFCLPVGSKPKQVDRSEIR